MLRLLQGFAAQVVVAVTLQIVFSAMVYAPTAAYLTELFPSRIRYTGLSVSYHLGAGVFGVFMPLIALSLCAHRPQAVPVPRLHRSRKAKARKAMSIVIRSS
jgi:MFS family permease